MQDAGSISMARRLLPQARAAMGEWDDMVDGLPSEVEVITLFVDDIASSKAFYASIFTAETAWGMTSPPC
jgi:hypothetical protein